MDEVKISKINNILFNLEKCINECYRRIEKLENNKDNSSNNSSTNINDCLFTISFDELNTIKNTILHLDEKLDKIQNDLDHILRPKDLDVKFRDILDKKG